MNRAGFTAEGTWYKGNLHCHSTQSDGKLSPKEVVKLYKENKYNFLCLSDHEKYVDYHDSLNSEEFILLPGIEASVNLVKEGAVVKAHHIHGIQGDSEMLSLCQNAYGNEEVFSPTVYEGSWDGEAAAQKKIDEFMNKGLLVMYNHPIWSKVSQSEFIHLNNVWGIEIYNHSAEYDGGLGVDTRDWDVILDTGKQIYGVATDDNHNFPGVPDCCGGWIVVKAAELTKEEIILNLKKGNFYSSTGPLIYDWGIKDGVAYVECSPCMQINFVCGGAIGCGKAVTKGLEKCRTEEDRRLTGEEVTCGEYKLNGKETYIRVECVDKNNRKAWSNAIFI